MKLFKVLCALLTLALAIPGGIATAESAQGAMGRYLEIPLTAPGEGEMTFAQANGMTYAVGWDGEVLFKSQDMMNWEQAKTGHDESVAPVKSGVNGLMAGDDGALYLMSGWAMYDKEGRPYIARVKDGATQLVQLDRDLPSGWDHLSMCVLPSGEMLGLCDTEAYRFSQDGATLQKYAVSGGEEMAAHGGEMAVFSRKNARITILDIESGQVLSTLALPSEMGEYAKIGYDVKGTLYLACRSGIYCVNAGGTLLVQIADGRLTTLGKPSAFARQVLFDAEGNLVIAFSEGGAMSLIAYRYDESVPTEPGTVLSVFTLYDTSTLRECATKFQQKNPDVLVDITVALPDGTAITRDDAIRTLNTELLAGKGPDVLVLDGLPVQSYIDKGVLEDLASVVQPMIDSGELAENLAGAFKRGGTIPAVPIRFLLPSIWGDVEGLNTMEDLAAWAQANPDALNYYAVDVDALIGTFYLSCAPAWFAEDGRLDEAIIEAFLTALKAVRGKWTYETFVEKTGWHIRERMQEAGMQMQEWNPYVRFGWNSDMEELQGMNLMSDGMQKQLPYLLRGPDTAMFPNGLLVGMESGDFAVLPGQAEGCFVPVLMMGASKDSVNSELVKRFIAFALSEEPQNVDLMDGFPVNVNALNAARERDSAPFSTGTGSYRSEWPDQARRDQLRGIIDTLKTPVIADFTLHQMIVKESAPFFEGNIDAAQAAANVCAKANAYLSE